MYPILVIRMDDIRDEYAEEAVIIPRFGCVCRK
jgi:hypothetical protein